MRYVEFVQAFFNALVEEVQDAQAQGRPPSVMDHQVGARLLPGYRFSEGGAPIHVQRALVHAHQDLKSLDVVEGDRYSMRLTRRGRQLAAAGANLEPLWAGIFQSTYLEPDERTLLTLLAAATETRFADFATAEVVDVYPILDTEAIAWDVFRRRQACIGLQNEGFITGMMSADPYMRATYAGLVVAQEQEVSALHQRIQAILTGIENVVAEFKQQLNLNTKHGRIEFAKDILALTNTQVGGRRRYLLVGIGNAPPHRRVADHHPRDNQERMERIVNAYLDRPPSFVVHTLPWEGGAIGVIIVDRDPKLIPHLWKRTVPGGLPAGAVKVRHGSQVEDPSANELADLIAEGDAARARAATEAGTGS